MHPDLQACRDELARALHGLDSAGAERPVDGAWSIANIVEHLDLAYTRNGAGMERRMKKPDATVRPRTLQQRIARFVVVTLGHFPSGRKSPEGVVPAGRPYDELAPVIDRHLLELDASLSAAERMFGGSAAVLDHPILGPFSVNDWRRFHLVHTRHHIRQIAKRRRDR